MFSRMLRLMPAQVSDLEDAVGVIALFLMLFIGLTLSGVA